MLRPLPAKMSQPFRPKHLFMTFSKDGGAGAFRAWCQFKTVAMESPALSKMEHVETALSLSLSIHISLALSLPIRRHAQRRLSNSNVYICLQFEDSIPFKVCQHAGRPQGNYRRPIWADEKDKVGQQEYIHVYTVCSQEFVYWNMRQDLNKTSFLELVDIVRNVVDDPRVSCVRGFDKSLARSSFKMRPFHLHSSAMAALE